MFHNKRDSALARLAVNADNGFILPSYIQSGQSEDTEYPSIRVFFSQIHWNLCWLASWWGLKCGENQLPTAYGCLSCTFRSVHSSWVLIIEFISDISSSGSIPWGKGFNATVIMSRFPGFLSRFPKRVPSTRSAPASTSQLCCSCSGAPGRYGYARL